MNSSKQSPLAEGQLIGLRVSLDTEMQTVYMSNVSKKPKLAVRMPYIRLPDSDVGICAGRAEA